jgi:hypothetical protein
MPDYVDYWDEEEGKQKRRACTPAEQSEVDKARATASVPIVPKSVSRKAARLALAHEGLFHLVQPAIDALPEPQRTLTQIEWNDSLTFQRDSPVVNAIGAAIGLNSELLDALFVTAGTLE